MAAPIPARVTRPSLSGHTPFATARHAATLQVIGNDAECCGDKDMLNGRSDSF